MWNIAQQLRNNSMLFMNWKDNPSIMVGSLHNYIKEYVDKDTNVIAKINDT
jgi:hypothetical protein